MEGEWERAYFSRENRPVAESNVHDLAHTAPHQPALVGWGFHRHDNGMSDRLLFVRAGDGVRSHILHVVPLESWPARNQRIFRDHLRARPEDAARYARLKWAIVAAADPGDEPFRPRH